MKLDARILFFLFISVAVNAQQKNNFNTDKNWSMNKKEFMFGSGMTTFQGDLGGRNQIGTDYSLVDIDKQALTMNGQIGFRYRFKPQYATTTTLHFGRVRGSDKFTQDLVRSSRNLSFKSPIISISQRMEWIFWRKEVVGGRYKIPGVNRLNDKSFQFYLFGGVGLTYFNPKGYYDGRWYKLHPLRTEGQGLPGGAKEYRRVTLIVPGGFGVRTGLGKLWRIGLEVSMTKTFTDYIDDVSTKYYDAKTLGQMYGKEAEYFANPATKNHYYFIPGEQRGDKQKDSYQYINVVMYRNFTYKPVNYNFGRNRSTKAYPRYKF
jgi:hypothetical protein